MFDNLKKIKTKVKNQSFNDGVVITKKRGRPEKPHMKTIQIRVDAGFDESMASFARELGIGKSQLIALAVKKYMSN